MEELKKQIQALQKRIEELEQWKKEKQRQQITAPLDEASKNIINAL